MLASSRLIFVGGLHRSGTTPLTRVLASHPEISGLHDTGVPEDEGQHLQDVYPRIREYGGLGRFALDPRAHLTEHSALCTPHSAERLLASWSPYWDTDRELLVEKSPPNLIMGRFLQGLFPDSALIVVVRHPVVVALASHKWNPLLVSRKGRVRRTLVGLVANWFAAHEWLAADEPLLRRLHVVNYESLVMNPDRELARITAFLNLSTPLDGGSLSRGLSSTYVERWRDMREGNPLQRRSRRVIERRFSTKARGFGYDLDDLTAVRAWSERDGGSR